MIRRCGNDIVLCTKHTTYAMRVLDTGHLEHLYYGASFGWDERTPDADICASCDAMAARRVFPLGNTISYDKEHPALTLENICLEISSQGKGDPRDPFVAARTADGCATLDFLFEDAEILRGEKVSPEGLPYALAEGHGDGFACDTLHLTLRDMPAALKLELFYTVYDDSDVISRFARLINESKYPLRLERLLSLQMDLPDDGWMLSVFHGAWVREMKREVLKVGSARIVNASSVGTSSSRSNPFVMLHRPDTTETAGEVIGLNLLYSGDHYESAGTNAWGKTRFLSGISPEGFTWMLAPGEHFDAPEAVMLWSGEGFGGISRGMHRFVRNHILRGTWKDRPRPVLLNTWEAAYFDINEDRFLKLARCAKDCGMELVVLDDGWFGERRDDTRALGDWTVNKKKFPSGLKGISRKLKEMGLGLGLWIEPEMVSVDSELYRAHPDRIMQAPGREHAEGRNQRLLDLADPSVVCYLTETIGAVLEEADVSYVKWDMNRIFSDVYSPSLPPERQGETAHRYVLGLYSLMKTLTERFPDVLFEGCASGGNRFDLGILCYFPQIWGSDNTDAICRARIQEGYSYGYPLSCVSAHVSSVPNHQTLRETGLSTRFNVACFGSLGYELNLCDLPKAALDAVKEQVSLYKKWRSVLQNGSFFRLRTGNTHKWICVAEDKKRAVCLLLQELAQANMPDERFRAAGLDPSLRYRFYNIPRAVDLMDFGDLVNTQSPVHIRQNSLMHRAVAKVYKLDGETEDHTVSGSMLMNAGITLAPAYAGTGFNDQTRCFTDFSSRLYFVEAVE